MNCVMCQFEFDKDTQKKKMTTTKTEFIDVIWLDDYDWG